MNIIYDYLFFDLDNTLTRSRSKITDEMKDILAKHIKKGRKVVVVSGAVCDQIRWQIDGVPCYTLGQNGNHAQSDTNTVLWEEKLSGDEKKVVMSHIESIPRTWEVTNEADLVEDRKCQISYSLLGHHEDIGKKEAFDNGGAMRKQLLVKYPFESDTLEVRVGGTTCLDYTRRGRNKGHYVARLIEEMGWKKDKAVYFGDMLFPGGNDETVIGVIDTQPVENPTDTIKKLQDIL